MGVICAAVHALGILTNHGAFDWHVASKDAQQQGRLAAEYCKKHGIELGILIFFRIFKNIAFSAIEFLFSE